MRTLHQVLKRLFLFSLPCLIVSTAIAETTESKAIELDSTTRQKCIQTLREGLNNDEFWPSMHAAEGLSNAGYGDEVAKSLKPRLSTESDLQHRCGLARELVRAGDRNQVAVLLNVLAHADDYGHTHACESLYKVNAIGDGKLLRKAMHKKGVPIQSLMAAGALARHGDANALQFIRKQLSQKDPNIARISAWLLGVIGTKQDIPALRKGLERTEAARDRAFFEHALACLGDAKGKQTLLQNLSSNDDGIRTDAANMAGIARMTSAQQPLLELLNDGTLDGRIRAAHSLLLLSQATEGKNRSLARVAKKPNTDIIPPEVVLDLPPSKNNPRNSEGDFINLKDGRVLFIYSHFLGGGGDHSNAQLSVRTSEDGGKTWSDDEQVVVKNEGGLNVMSVSLLRLQTGEIALFYISKVSLTDCRTEMRISTDEAKTWSKPIKCITDQVGYYVMNNDRALQLKSGRLVLPVCLHRLEGEPKADWHGKDMCYLSDDNGKTWRRSQSTLIAKNQEGKRLYAQEPGVVELKDGRVMMFARSSIGSQLVAYSKDGCETWSDFEPSNINSPRSPATIERIPSTGDLLMVWNNHEDIAPELKSKRTPLTVAISRDDGKTWENKTNLYDNPNGWYCYNAIDFVGETVLIGHCAGDRTKNNGLAESKITRFNLNWLYQDRK